MNLIQTLEAEEIARLGGKEEVRDAQSRLEGR